MYPVTGTFVVATKTQTNKKQKNRLGGHQKSRETTLFREEAMLIFKAMHCNFPLVWYHISINQ
jgi:hypothetical protein